MAMTITESLAWVQEFIGLVDGLLDVVDVVVFPPFTALWAMHQALQGHRVQLGGQNMAPTKDLARTGEISATLLKDVGCERVLLGHWEVRHHLGDDDDAINRKVRLACEAGLAPVLLVGEARDEDMPCTEVLRGRLERLLDGSRAQDIERMILVYEPEEAIGKSAPLAPQQATAGCAFIRRWIGQQWGEETADRVRLMYAGSLAPQFANGLLYSPEVDGVGGTRRGRNAETFAAIVRQVARAKAGWTD
jgi:triosephosphate isomerase